jgi:hypothetical protein
VKRLALDNPLLPIIAYLGVVGILAVLAGGVAPDSVESGTPAWLGYAWSGCMALGGLAATIGGIISRTRLESAGLSLLMVSLGLFVWAGTITSETAGDDVLALAALLGSFLLRMRLLHRERRAQRIAAALVRDGCHGID